MVDETYLQLQQLKQDPGGIYLNWQGEILGPFAPLALKEAFATGGKLPLTTPFSHQRDGIFSPLFEHPLFTRRKAPDRVLKTKEHQRFWPLIKGVMTGPITLEELKNHVENKTLLPTHEVSLDQGKTWQKIYQLPTFDRRNRELQTSGQLPEKEADEIFTSASINLAEIGIRAKETETLAVIAGTSLQIKSSKDHSEQVNESHQKKYFKLPSKKYLYGIISLVTVIALGLTALKNKTKEVTSKAPVPEVKSPVMEVKKIPSTPDTSAVREQEERMEAMKLQLEQERERIRLREMELEKRRQEQLQRDNENRSNTREENRGGDDENAAPSGEEMMNRLEEIEGKEILDQSKKNKSREKNAEMNFDEGLGVKTLEESGDNLEMMDDEGY